MSDETGNLADATKGNLTPNTDERKVSDKQLSKWKGEGGALPADDGPEEEDPDSGQ